MVCRNLMRRIVTEKKRAGLATSPIKGSLNLLVTKGPEETTDENKVFSKTLLARSISGFPLAF